MSEEKKKEDIQTVVEFCPGCFADTRGGSWGEGTQSGYCFNCGSGGTVMIPIWAVDSIRKQASWVGSRYYPNDEDRATQRELRDLRATIKEFPGRTASEFISSREGEPQQFMVTQLLGQGKNVSIFVQAATAEAALEYARTRLPYVPEVAASNFVKGNR